MYCSVRNYAKEGDVESKLLYRSVADYANKRSQVVASLGRELKRYYGKERVCAAMQELMFRDRDSTDQIIASAQGTPVERWKLIEAIVEVMGESLEAFYDRWLDNFCQLFDPPAEVTVQERARIHFWLSIRGRS